MATYGILLTQEVLKQLVARRSMHGIISYENYWEGIHCDTDGNIIGIYFFRNGLDGIFPPTISQLTNLHYVYIFNDAPFGENANRIYALSDAICELHYLEHINLDNVKIEGTVPSCLGELTSLVTLSLRGNYLTGVLTDINWSN